MKPINPRRRNPQIGLSSEFINFCERPLPFPAPDSGRSRETSRSCECQKEWLPCSFLEMECTTTKLDGCSPIILRVQSAAPAIEDEWAASTCSRSIWKVPAPGEQFRRNSVTSVWGSSRVGRNFKFRRASCLKMTTWSARFCPSSTGFKVVPWFY